MTYAFDHDGMTLTAHCSRCQCDSMRPPVGYRLWLCYRCGTATDTPMFVDSNGTEMFITDDGDLIHVAE